MGSSFNSFWVVEQPLGHRFERYLRLVVSLSLGKQKIYQIELDN